MTTTPTNVATLLGSTALTAVPAVNATTAANANASAITQADTNLNQLLNQIQTNADNPVGSLIDVSV